MTKARAPRRSARTHRGLTQRHRRRDQHELNWRFISPDLERDRDAAIIEPHDAAFLAIDQILVEEARPAVERHRRPVAARLTRYLDAGAVGGGDAMERDGSTLAPIFAARRILAVDDDAK